MALDDDLSRVPKQEMKRQETFLGVLCNTDDQFIVRELLTELVPLKDQNKIVTEFNLHVSRYNARGSD